MSYITAIGTATPSHRFRQAEIAEFMTKAMQLNIADERKLKTIFKASGIEFRHSVLEDYGKIKDFAFYADTVDLEPFPGTQKRLQFFHQNALALSLKSVEDLALSNPRFTLQAITHLIVVCCTGMYAPGLDIDLVNALKLPTTVQRTAINFMGCHAAFNALKIANAFCSCDPQAKVLIVCTELCSLHFQRPASEDNLIANALFADGSAALLVEGESDSETKLELENFHSDMAVEGSSHMAWTIGDLGFEMRLSTYVPDLIQKGIGKLTTALLDKIAVSFEDIQHFVIHPGGIKILQAIEKELNISKTENEDAYEVLRNYGNMSSPTVLFVLKQLFQRLNSSHHGQRVLSFAFGPGLTLESMVLNILSARSNA